MFDAAQIDARIELLERYRTAILAYFNGDFDGDELEENARWINQNTIAARTAVVEAGTYQEVTIAPPPAVGGMIARNIDPFGTVFESIHGASVIPMLSNVIDRAIGVYKHLKNGTGLVRLPMPRQAFELEGALERALRPHFRSGPPSTEREVQDAVEDILHALGISFHREKETAPVGPRASRPDFTVPDLELAIDVKLAKPGHGARSRKRSRRT